jgi:flagellar hook-length control protein FliK
MFDEDVAQTKMVNVQATTEKELGSVKLRPDILQALSLRASDSKQQTNTSVESPSLDMNFDKNIPTAKTMNAQLQLPELLERVSSKTLSSPAQTLSDRVGLGLTTTSAVASGQVKADVPVLDIQPSLQNAAWSRVMTSRVLWMAREGVQEASLKLNPAQLGPVEVRLNMHQDQANVTFIAHSAATRDALEQAIPRLRESFAQHGLELTNADVSQQSFNQSGENEQQSSELGSGSISRELSQNADNVDDQEDNVLANEQQLELGLSVYA